VSAAADSNSPKGSSDGALAQQAQQGPVTALKGGYRPSVLEQAVRALLHMVQFAVAYFIML
jgi:copper transporter 1